MNRLIAITMMLCATLSFVQAASARDLTPVDFDEFVLDAERNADR